nr:hypothetical protein [Bradyrhizobium sp. 192]
MLQILGDQPDKLGRAACLISHAAKQGTLSDNPHFGFDESFCGKAVGFVALETEHVARQMERVDLAATVREQPVGSHRSGDDLVDVLRLVSFAKHLGTPAILELAG